jgi:phenylalanyl-tRNA synthetase beta subunit
MQDTERTLTAAEADAACDRVVEWAGASFGAERR